MSINFYAEQAMLRTTIRLRRFIHAVLARPELCSTDHDNVAYDLAKAIGHAAISQRRDLAPSEPLRY